MLQSSSWSLYNASGAEKPARPRLIETLNRFFPHSKGHALDLGCGGGRDSRELLSRGWTVDAVDSDVDAMALTSMLHKNFSGLNVRQKNFESLELQENRYDLINASFSLPFCRPEKFSVFWAQLRRSLKPGGALSGELFGLNDEWRFSPRSGLQLTFHSQADIFNLCSGLVIHELREEEFDGPTFERPHKHWHIWTCFVRKPDSTGEVASR